MSNSVMITLRSRLAGVLLVAGFGSVDDLDGGEGVVVDFDLNPGTSRDRVEALHRSIVRKLTDDYHGQQRPIHFTRAQLIAHVEAGFSEWAGLRPSTSYRIA